MLNPCSLTELVQRYRQGDPDAAGQLFAHYAQRLSRLADQHLSRKLAGRMEGEDVVQSVFRTFFRRTTAGEFQIDSSAQLWQLLAKITVRKARAQGRYHTAAVREVAAEQPEGLNDAILELAAREPGPEDAAVLMDHIEVLLKGLPSRYCQILELRLRGYAATDIASHPGVARRTVYRALALLGQRLAKM
jgi:RNA polymerase sigma-70 factor (ECF subfamily)